MSKKPARSHNPNAVSNAAMAAQSIAQAVTGRRKGSEGISIHVHVGDLFLIGFDEAIDAEEWGAREVNHDGAGGVSARQEAEPERKTKRRLSVRKGDVHLTADEDAEPAGLTRARKRAVKPRAGTKRRRS